jgi:hypothetical protein
MNEDSNRDGRLVLPKMVVAAGSYITLEIIKRVSKKKNVPIQSIIIKYYLYLAHILFLECTYFCSIANTLSL